MEQPTQITAQDIANVVNIIDTACTRGAFRGPEMSAVGLTRDKFAALITKSQEASSEEPPQGELNFDTETGSVEENIENGEVNDNT